MNIRFAPTVVGKRQLAFELFHLLVKDRQGILFHLRSRRHSPAAECLVKGIYFRAVLLPQCFALGVREITHILAVKRSEHRFHDFVTRCHVIAPIVRLHKGVPFGLFHAEQPVLFIKHVRIVHHALGIVFAQLVYGNSYPCKCFRRDTRYRQHPVPSIAISVHIFFCYGIIGQNIHLHCRNFIFLVYNAYLLFNFFFGQYRYRPVIFLITFSIVVNNHFFSLVKIEFCVQLCLFRK